MSLFDFKISKDVIIRGGGESIVTIPAKAGIQSTCHCETIPMESGGEAISINLSTLAVLAQAGIQPSTKVK